MVPAEPQVPAAGLLGAERALTVGAMTNFSIKRRYSHRRAYRFSREWLIACETTSRESPTLQFQKQVQRAHEDGAEMSSAARGGSSKKPRAINLNVDPACDGSTLRGGTR